jgi:vacuolar protein sorting-associated protein 29
MDIQGPVITTYVYQLIDNDVRVEKVEFRFVASARGPPVVLTHQRRKEPEPAKDPNRPPVSLPQAIPTSPVAAGGW